MSSSLPLPHKNATPCSEAVHTVDNRGSSVAGLADQPRSDISQMADKLAARAGGVMTQLAQAISEHMPQEGVVGTASQTVAQSLQEGGHYLEESAVSGTTASIERLVRRYPFESMVTGMAVGYLVARILRKST